MAGNWKMYKTVPETVAFFEKFNPLVAGAKHCEIAICPTFVNLSAAVQATAGTNVGIGAQNLFNGAVQTVRIFQHDLIKFFALEIFQLARLQSFQIQPDRSHGSFQFMGDGVEKRIVLFIAADFPNQEYGVQNKTCNEDWKENGTQYIHHTGAPIGNNPANIERNG